MAGNLRKGLSVVHLKQMWQYVGNCCIKMIGNE